MNPKKIELGGFIMSYLRAEEILPKEVLETVQQYVSGRTIYIPSKEKQVWGSGTDTKQILDERNQEIYDKYKNGISVKVMAKKYSLSEKSIQRIIRNKKASDSSENNADFK